MLSSHVKISALLRLHNKSCLSHQKTIKSEMVWYFIGVYIIYNITWLLRDTKFLFSCWRNISRVSAANKWNIFQHSKRNFVSPRSHVISSTSYHHTCIVCMYWVKLLIKALKIYVVVNFLFQVIFVFLLFLGMLILC